MSSQVVDASLVAAPRQRNTDDEKKAIKEGRIPTNWKAKPAKLRHKDRDMRWTVKFTKAKPREDGSSPPVDLAISLFGYQNHVSIDRRFGFICRWAATDAAAYEGRRLRQGLLDKTNTAGGVLDRYRLPIGGQREVPDQELLRQPHPSQEAEAALCPRRYGVPTMRNRKSARVSSMCSPSKRIGWGYSSELSESPERRPKSEWPISLTTSNALSSCARSPSHDRPVLGKATHYPIAIRLNQ
jgi:IS5 family transposase